MRKPSQIPHEGRAKDDVKKNFQLFSGRQPNFSWVMFFLLFAWHLLFYWSPYCFQVCWLPHTNSPKPDGQALGSIFKGVLDPIYIDLLVLHHLAFGPIAMLRRFASLATSATQLYYDWKQSSRWGWKYLNCDQLSCWLEHLQDANWFFPRLGLEKLRAPWEEVFYPDFLAHLLTLSKTGGWYCQRSQQGAWGAWWRGNHNHQSRRRWQLQWCLWWRWQWWPMVDLRLRELMEEGKRFRAVRASVRNTSVR